MQAAVEDAPMMRDKPRVLLVAARVDALALIAQRVDPDRGADPVAYARKNKASKCKISLTFRSAGAITAS
jgi:hypothetical protein